MCDSAGKRKSRNFKTSFFAAPTPTSRGSNHMTLILMILITTMMARNPRSNLFLKNFSGMVEDE